LNRGVVPRVVTQKPVATGTQRQEEGKQKAGGVSKDRPQTRLVEKENN